MTEHVWFECEQPCSRPGTCPYCDGGLGLCTVCGGFEGSLTKECCGRRLSEEEENEIYNNGRNFKDGRWWDKEGNDITEKVESERIEPSV